MSKLTKNPVMVLQELTVKKDLAPPNFEIIASISGTHENRFDYRVRVAGVEAVGTGSSKQIGKHDAAYKALKLLEECGIYDSKEMPMEEFKASVMQKQAGFGPGSPLKQSLNCIGPLKDLCVEHKIEDPVFTEKSDVGPPHCREFTYECCIGPVKTVATGNTKKMAKQLAAKEMIDKLKVFLPDIVLEAPRRNEELKTLPPSEKDEIVLNIYNKTFATVIPDKKIKVENFPTVFNKLMLEHDKNKDDFIEELSERTEEALEAILVQIGLRYETIVLQEDPYIMNLSINCDVPFGVCDFGKTEDEAKQRIIERTFEMLNCFIK